MTIQLFCTRNCSHRPNLERELKDLGIDYQVVFVEDEPDLAMRLHIRHSPSLVENDRLLCTGQPTEHELKELLAARNASA